jgi:hypothetical protein
MELALAFTRAPPQMASSFSRSRRGSQHRRRRLRLPLPVQILDGPPRDLPDGNRIPLGRPDVPRPQVEPGAARDTAKDVRGQEDPIGFVRNGRNRDSHFLPGVAGLPLEGEASTIRISLGRDEQQDRECRDGRHGQRAVSRLDPKPVRIATLASSARKRAARPAQDVACTAGELGLPSANRRKRS